MKITDIKRQLRPVPGYEDQVFVREPALADLTACEDKSDEYDVENGGTEAQGKFAAWFFQNYVRDPEGQPFEGLDAETIFDELPIACFTAAINVFTGANDGQPKLSTVPNGEGAAAS